MDKNNELNTSSNDFNSNSEFTPVDNQVNTGVNQDLPIDNYGVNDPNVMVTDSTLSQTVPDDYNGYDNVQTNLNKSINNYTDVVGKYNQVSNEFIDNGEGISSFEEQLNNSQDLVVYTQQPNKPMDDPNMNGTNYQDNGMNNQQYNYYDSNYNTNTYGYNNIDYTNNPSMGMDNEMYPNDYNNDMGYNNYQNMNYNNGYDNYNMDYSNNNNYMNDNYNNYNMGYDNYNNNVNGYDNQYVANSNIGYDNGYQNMNYSNNYNDGYSANNNYVNDNYSNTTSNQTKFINNINNDNNSNNNVNSTNTKRPKTIGPEAFDKKMKKNLRPFNILLFIIYALIIGVIGYFGYQYWVNRNDFYFSKDKMNLAEDSSYQEQVYIKGKIADNKDYEWKSDNEAIVSVDSTGKIVGKAEGTANVKVTSKKTKKTNTIIVKVIKVDIKQFTIKDKEKVVYIGNSYTIVPLINGQSSLTMNYEWENSNESVATVDEYGVVTPKKAGSTTITIKIPNTEFKASIIIVVAAKK